MFSELFIVITIHGVFYLPPDVGVFETLRKMNELRPFKLVFLPEGSGFSRGKARQGLADALDLVVSKGHLDFLASPPTIR